MKYDLLISDYDGTLSVGNKIPKETLDAVNEFVKKGGIFTVCSGREFRSIRKICLEHGIQGLVVSFQGARIHEIESGKRIFDGGLDSEIALKIFEEVKESGLEPMVYLEDRFCIEKDTDLTRSYENAVAMKGVVCSLEQAIKGVKKVCKLGWLGDDVLVNQTADKFNEKYKGKGVFFNSGATGLLEAINPDCAKDNAVRFLSEYYSVPFEKIIAVGDSTNDVALIDGPWHGVAVGDGREELKAVAKEVTVPYKESPIKVLLEKYCLKD